MKLDRTLLDKNGPPTEKEMREYFIKNDYTTAVSDFDVSCMSSEQSKLYLKARGFFRETWGEQLSKMGGKRSMMNFSDNYPLKLLEKKDEELILGAVSKILCDEEQYAKNIDAFFESMEPQLMTGFQAYADSVKKSVDDLSDDEIRKVIDKVVDAFLNIMMQNLMKSQDIPKLLKATRGNASKEDFNEKTPGNFSKRDFRKAFYHTRTKIGLLLSLDELQDDEHHQLKNSDSIFENEYSDYDLQTEYDFLIEAYKQVLDSVEREILDLRMRNFTQKDIAQRLGYKTPSAVSKRMKIMQKKFDDMMR